MITIFIIVINSYKQYIHTYICNKLHNLKSFKWRRDKDKTNFEESEEGKMFHLAKM